MVPVLRKKRYWLIVLTVLVIIAFMFTPFILSTSSFTQFLVSRINGKIPGSISVGSWLVDWHQGFLCQDIVYENPQNGVRISVPRLTSTQGLVKLILTPRNFGLVSMESPVLEIKKPSHKGKQGSSIAEKTTPSGSNLSILDKFSMQVQVRDGKVMLQPEDPQPEIGFKNIDIHSRLSAGELHYDLKFRNLDGLGDFACKGRLNLPAGKKALMETLFTDTDINIHDFQIRDYLTFAGQYKDLPTGEGVLNSSFHLKTLGREDFELSGKAEFTSLRLTGGFLAEDDPAFETLSITLQGLEWSKLFWSIKQFHVKSEAGTISCDAESRGDKLRMNSSGNLNIPVLFDQFSHLLHVQEKAFVETGSLEYTADVLMEGQKGKFDFMSKAMDLGGLYDGRPFAWNTPITAILHGENNGLDVNVSRLQIESPFIQAFGKGDLSSFTLQASADLGTALIELDKLFQNPWAGSGELKLDIKAAASDTEGLYDVNSDLNIGHFSLSRHDKVVVPNQHFSMVGSGQIPFSLLRKREGRFDVQFALSSWLGEIFLAMDGLKIPDGLVETRYSTDTNLRLDNLTRLMHALDYVPESTEVDGEAQIQAAGYIENNIIGFDEFNTRINHLAFKKDDTEFKDSEVRLQIDRLVNEDIPSLVIHDLAVAKNPQEFFSSGAGLNSIDLTGSGLFLHGVSLDAELGKVQLEEFVVGDWHKPTATLKAKGFIDGDLDKITPLLQNFGYLDTKVVLAGSGRLEFISSGNSGSGQVIQTELNIEDFSVAKEGKQLLSEDKLSLKFQMEGNSSSDEILLKNLHLYSLPIVLRANGSFSYPGALETVELQGRIMPKLDKLSAILQRTFDTDLRMQGQGEHPFILMYQRSDNNEKPFGGITFSTNLVADNIQYKGIIIRALKMPVSFAESKLQAEVKGRVNDGQIDIPISSDFSREPPLLEIRKNRQVVSGVELEKPLVEGILQEIHPLFGVLTSPSGQLDVQVDSFEYPVKPEGQVDAEFAAQFDVSRINLDSSGLLRQILNSFALEDEQLKLRDSTIHCRGAEARITCSPVKMQIADSEMIMSGSVGMDKSLDYVLEIPITTKLVSPEVYHFIEGATVKVPIKGTIDRPVFDQQSLTSTIRDLIKDAAMKVVEKQASKLLPEIMENVLGVPEKK